MLSHYGGDTRPMLGHLGVNMPDLAAAKRYYTALMPLVGFELFLDTDDEFAFRPANSKPGTYLFFYPSAVAGAYSSDRTGLQHLAFMVRNRSLVDAVHEFASGSGNTIVYPPSTSRSTRALLRHLLAGPVWTEVRSGLPPRSRLDPIQRAPTCLRSRDSGRLMSCLA